MRRSLKVEAEYPCEGPGLEGLCAEGVISP